MKQNLPTSEAFTQRMLSRKNLEPEAPDIFLLLRKKYGTTTAVASALRVPLRTYFDWQKRERNGSWSRNSQRVLVMRLLRDALALPLTAQSYLNDNCEFVNGESGEEGGNNANNHRISSNSDHTGRIEEGW